ncbi:uncharacterized protein BX663DRAFT_518388 [Cokeromyces recurvatus]|uniref:uncharacterized protein n=1 Tax=Cokeromyces recurvatus TaxID=90255 RepID=UPI0022204391|nr:uncharacterized protein BX663DRAFT_518388 [Cokeromyces recurvatus]KAI7900355.1 hypothetical protein BX663DRAFT_518388 [Cokeromyces recurvatus]
MAIKGPIYWAVVPFTIITVFTISKAGNKPSPSQHPIRFIPSGEPQFDSANMDRIRADWHLKNNGIGLRDVSRSGGGV